MHICHAAIVPSVKLASSSRGPLPHIFGTLRQKTTTDAAWTCSRANLLFTGSDGEKWWSLKQVTYEFKYLGETRRTRIWIIRKGLQPWINSLSAFKASLWNSPSHSCMLSSSITTLTTNFSCEAFFQMCIDFLLLSVSHKYDICCGPIYPGALLFVSLWYGYGPFLGPFCSAARGCVSIVCVLSVICHYCAGICELWCFLMLTVLLHLKWPLLQLWMHDAAAITIVLAIFPH